MTESAAEAIARAGNPVELLRNAQSRPTIFPVTPEFSNWRSEQLAWRKSVALLDQSHHMTDLFISGPDALRLLRDRGQQLRELPRRRRQAVRRRQPRGVPDRGRDPLPPRR
ncbi:hypothetical protein [Microbacterium sp. P04]|uniref:hypothetical protein n=1 Tax=Microbacterium sp. P04 TaxID=3366947 RepID=UPI003744E86C